MLGSEKDEDVSGVYWQMTSTQHPCTYTGQSITTTTTTSATTTTTILLLQLLLVSPLYMAHSKINSKIIQNIQYIIKILNFYI